LDEQVGRKVGVEECWEEAWACRYAVSASGSMG